MPVKLKSSYWRCKSYNGSETIEAIYVPLLRKKLVREARNMGCSGWSDHKSLHGATVNEIRIHPSRRFGGQGYGKAELDSGEVPDTV